MIQVQCPHCGKRLFDAEGYYKISINCRGCKKVSTLQSAKPALQQIQKDFEHEIAQAGTRANKPQIAVSA